MLGWIHIRIWSSWSRWLRQETQRMLPPEWLLERKTRIMGTTSSPPFCFFRRDICKYSLPLIFGSIQPYLLRKSRRRVPTRISLINPRITSSWWSLAQYGAPFLLSFSCGTELSSPPGPNHTLGNNIDAHLSVWIWLVIIQKRASSYGRSMLTYGKSLSFMSRRWEKCGVTEFCSCVPWDSS